MCYKTKFFDAGQLVVWELSVEMKYTVALNFKDIILKSS